ncbi:MAG: DUF5915 domain-containing protein, partial [Planctomycetota bacterium]
ILIGAAHEGYGNFDVASVVTASDKFIDGLSNWYVRRNRRRFWRSRGEDDRDKLAAYQTLYEALVTLTKVVAPIVPFVTETMYQHLVVEQDGSAPVSVHLCRFPEADESLVDRELSQEMDAAVALVGQALSLRTANNLRVRQPLAGMKVSSDCEVVGRAVKRFGATIAEELNVKSVDLVERAGELMSCSVLPNLAKVGPKFGKDVPVIKKALAEADGDAIAETVRQGRPVVVEADGRQFQLEPDEVLVENESPEGLAASSEGDAVIALDTRLTPELVAEGMARDVVRHLQQLRKDEQLDMDDRIAVQLDTDDEQLREAVEAHREYIMAETLAESLEWTDLDESARQATIEEAGLKLHLSKV